MLKPSLYALYKQGRFRTPALEDSKEGMRQVERFAVAMLALVLQHDQDFRKDFWIQVCNRSWDDVGEFLLELEVTGCGDLVLRKRDNSEAFAFEFKVKSPLQPHQDPRNPEFFTSGYGQGIRQQRWVKSTYFLVQNEPVDLKTVKESVPSCRSESWRSISKCSYQNPLIRDLFESFGRLDIPAFIHMNTQKISLGHGHSTLDAVKLYKLLHAVAGVIGSKSRALDIDLEDLENDKRGGYIALKFVPGENKEKWHALVQPRNEIVGSFGYSQYDRSTLDVWFFCGTPNAAAKVRSLLPKRFPLKELPPEEKNRPGQRNCVWISLPAEDSTDNQYWFISVFDSLIKCK